MSSGDESNDQEERLIGVLVLSEGTLPGGVSGQRKGAQPVDASVHC